MTNWNNNPNQPGGHAWAVQSGPAQAGPFPGQPQGQPQGQPFPGQPFPGQPQGQPQGQPFPYLASQFAETKASADRYPFLSCGSANDPHLYLLVLESPLECFEVEKAKGGRRDLYTKATPRVVWTSNGTAVLAGGLATVLWVQDDYGISAKEVKAYQCAVVGKPNPTSQEIRELFPGANGAPSRYAGTLIGCAVTGRANKKDPAKVYNQYRWRTIPAEAQAQILSAVQAGHFSDDMGRRIVLG